MLFITMVLSSSEWDKIKSAAATYWPNATLDPQMSRQEASRRLLLSGIDQLRATAQAERQAALDANASDLQPRGDYAPPQLPGDPK